MIALLDAIAEVSARSDQAPEEILEQFSFAMSANTKILESAVDLLDRTVIKEFRNTDGSRVVWKINSSSDKEYTVSFKST